MTVAIRYVASRPALVAIGPSAAASVETADSDLDHVDVIVIDGHPDERELLAWVERRLFTRALISCLYDLADIAWRDTATRVASVFRACTQLPVWFVCASVERLGHDPERELHRLATTLAVCAINPGSASPVKAATFAASALQVPGLLCCHPEDIAVVAHAGTVGTFIDAKPTTIPANATGAFVSIRWSEQTTLHEVNDICNVIAELAPEHATVLYAAPGPLAFSVSAMVFTR